MNRREFVRNTALLSASAALGNVKLISSVQADEIPAGFTPIFNGKDLTGCRGILIKTTSNSSKV